MVSKYISLVDGLLFPGGHYDMDFKLHDSDTRDNNRDRIFKICLNEYALKRGMPVLGLCAGMALINLALGGSIGLVSKKE